MFDQKAIDETTAKFVEMRKILMDGPWMYEPDRHGFIYEGFDCLIQRSEMTFAWCGYVGVPSSHPLYGIDFMSGEDFKNPLQDLDAHGGVTYSRHCGGIICHLTEEKDDLFWIGFDCAHAGDLSPGIRRRKDYPREIADSDVLNSWGTVSNYGLRIEVD